MAAQSTILLQTKLRPPHITGGNVARPALHAMLNRYAELPLTLVSAPAGSGKSHLVTQWLQTFEGPFGWISLDADEQDIGRFVRYLLAAIDGAFAGTGLTARSVLDSADPLQPDELAEALLCDMELLPGPLVLVMDDYQNAEDPEVRAFMTRLLQNCPADLHLVLISRTDPLLPLARLRSQLQLGEIRSAELRFSLAEATELVETLVEETVEPDIIELLHTRTEGWITGLQLTAILLRSADDHRALARQFADHTHKWIVEYLVSEVLDRLEDRQRAQMLQSAIFPKFSADMLEATLGPLLGTGEGSAFLNELAKANLFLISLDDAGIWYRYHHLFGELLSHRLRREMSEESVRALHLRAAAWFEERGLFDEAIIQALAADAPQEAALIVERHLHEALNQEEWRDVEQWLALLPETVQERPGILIARAFAQHFRYRLPAVRALIARAEAQLMAGTNGAQDTESDHRNKWLGAIRCLEGQEAHNRGQNSKSMRLLQDALRLLPAEWGFVRGIAEFYYIIGLQQSGRTETALHYVIQELSLQTEKANLRTTRLYFGLGGIHYANAACTELQNVALIFAEVAQRLERTISTGWAHYLIGWSSYQLNDLARAEASFRLVQRLRQKVHVRAVVESYTGLALTLHAQSRVAEARATAEELRDFFVQSGPLAFIPIADSLMNRLMLMDGERIKIPRIENLEDQLSSGIWEMPALTTVRAILCDGDAAQFPVAVELLDRMRNYAQRTNTVRRIIEVDVLRSLFYGALGDTENAKTSLISAVRLGASGDVLRTFLDEGPGLRPYLEMLLACNVERLYVQRILSAFDATPAPTSRDLPILTPLQMTEAALTDREVEVLLLLAERLTNDEIADRLVISTATVKKHARNIYQKLNVTSRRQAVVRARTLGILHLSPIAEERV